jgi:ribonuclease BN (tRNA processing enzyme)
LSFTVTVLGCSATFATRERAASGYLVQFGDAALWLDAGAGTWRNLLEHIDYPELDAIILTHRHPDHTTDVFQVHHAVLYGQPQRLPKIPLWAPNDTIGRLRAFANVDDSFELHPISAGDEIAFRDAQISFHHMAHPVETVGVRIEYDGGVFAYTADTGPGGDLGNLAKGADLLICEATFQDGDGPWEGHMLASEAATAAVSNGVSHLVLSHLPSHRDLGLSLQQAHHGAHGVTIELAADGERYEVIG